MPVVEHGVAGASLTETGREKYGTAARRGAFVEALVGAALQDWLATRIDELHLFHDLQHLRAARAGGKSDGGSLGRMNIDHVVLSGRTWLMIDAKGCGAGTLGVDGNGRGRLLRPDGTSQPQPWMDDALAKSRAGALYRLTGGKPGHAVWVVPDGTSYDETISRARFLQVCGRVTIATISEARGGYLDRVLPMPQLPADPADVKRLSRHLHHGG